MGRHGSDSDEDETFYYRYSTPSSTTTSSQSNPTSGVPKHGVGPKSGGLAPSKSTVYVSNLDYELTNSDLFTIFSTFGKVARVTVVKDRATRRSRGVAFVLFVSRTDAISAAKQMNGKVLNGRTLSASIAVDNGRAPEFIRRRVYKDKSRCYECGEGGHLSYECPKNQLGPRERPVPKKGRREKAQRRKKGDEEEEEDGEREWECGDVFDDDNWASVVDNGADQRLLMREKEVEEKRKGKKVKRASYFSDESSTCSSSVGVGGGSMMLVEQMREERARRDETVEKWKMLYLAIKNELDDLIQRTHQGALYWRAEEDDDLVEELQQELKVKDETIEFLKAQIASMKDEENKRKREVDILRQSLKILSSKKGSLYQHLLSTPL